MQAVSRLAARGSHLDHRMMVPDRGADLLPVAAAPFPDRGRALPPIAAAPFPPDGRGARARQGEGLETR
ncbi:hypothetical protein B1964_12525 [Gordonia sp. i37]|nr:hypothetical protein B1964_12525 [Gordonia sp. i37]